MAENCTGQNFDEETLKCLGGTRHLVGSTYLPIHPTCITFVLVLHGQSLHTHICPCKVSGPLGGWGQKVVKLGPPGGQCAGCSPCHVALSRRHQPWSTGLNCPAGPRHPSSTSFCIHTKQCLALALQRQSAASWRHPRKAKVAHTPRGHLEESGRTTRALVMPQHLLLEQKVLRARGGPPSLPPSPPPPPPPPSSCFYKPKMP
jgi:hypothetical protein